MKTSLKYIALALAVALPAASTANALGLSLPDALSPTYLFSALVTTLAVLTVVADYARQPRLMFLHKLRSGVAEAQLFSAANKSKYPLAA